jgi:hypothetical protein
LEWIYGKELPGAYAHEHITHYTNEGLRKRLEEFGFEIEDCQYVGYCEMIFKARKREAHVGAESKAAKARAAAAIGIADDVLPLSQKAAT